MVWQRIVAGGRLDHGAAGSLTYGGGPSHGREVLLSRALNSVALHCNPNCTERQCNTPLYPASVHCATAVVGAHLTREEVIAALLSPSIKWMGEFDEVGNAQKFAFTEICTTPEKLPTQTYPPPLLAQLRAPPLFPPSANCRQQLQPEDCCRLCSHWIACQRADVDFNPHNISCPA